MDEQAPTGFLASLNDIFASFIVHPLNEVLFYDLIFWDNDKPSNLDVPAVVAWLILYGVWFLCWWIAACGLISVLKRAAPRCRLRP